MSMKNRIHIHLKKQKANKKFALVTYITDWELYFSIMWSYVLTFFIGSTLGCITMAFMAGATRNNDRV